MKSKVAERSVKNSGLKTKRKFENFSCKYLVVPGITVERNKTILF
jgi:hypothetical protein